MMKFNLVIVNTVDQAAVAANGTASDGDVNHGTKLLKELVDPRVVKWIEWQQQTRIFILWSS